MAYRVFFETRARQEFLGLPKEVQKRLASALEDLQHDPRPPGIKKLTAREGYRLRQGDYRLLYVIDDSEKRIKVYRIGHRREIYR